MKKNLMKKGLYNMNPITMKLVKKYIKRMNTTRLKKLFYWIEDLLDERKGLPF